jgi:broad specificity phosphatase PhoE
VSEHELWLVRHGETEWSISGQHTGVTDIDLTDTGREQARALANRLQAVDFGLVLVSPRTRARDTAELAGIGGGAQVDDDLAEWDYGEYEGITTEQIHERAPGWSLWTDGCPGGEQADEVAARVDRVIARARAADGPVAAVAHGHVLRVLGARWVGLDAGAGELLALDTAAVCVLGWEHHNPVLQHWNT